MKKKNFCLMAFALALGQAAWADSIVRLQMQRPLEVNRPFFTDTVNVKGEKHNVEKLLLESLVPLKQEEGNSVELTADSIGWFHLDADAFLINDVEKNRKKRNTDEVDEVKEKHDLLYVLHTKLRSDRFVKTRLKFKTANRMELYIDGQKKASKLTRQDSVQVAGECVAELRMEPGVLYDVAIKILAEKKDTCAPALQAEWTYVTDTTVAVACAPDLKGRYLLPNTVFGNRVTRVSISPDGKYLLTQYTDWYNQQRSNTYTVLSEVKSGKELATFTQGAKKMEWMPRSAKLYYTATSDNGVKIIIVDPKTGRETEIADGVPDGGFRWAPDEQSLYFSMYEAVEGDKAPVHRVLSPADRVPGTRGRWFIACYDLKTGLRERLTYGLRTSSLQDISADGRYLLYTMGTSTPDKWPFGTSALYCMDLQTRAVDTLVCEDAFMGGARFSPDGKQVLLTGGPEAFGGIGKNIGNHPIGNNYDTQAFLLDRATKRIDPITKDFNPTVSPVQWNRYDGCIYFKTSDGDREPVYRYDPRKRQFEKLPLEGDCVHAFSLAQDAPYAAYTSVTASSSSAGYLFDTKKERSTLIADPYSEILDGLELGEIQEWNFTASDGTPISGYYCLPPAFDANKKYPLIVYYYGGTTPTVRAMDTPYAAQLFASRGYVVYIVNPSGTIGFGQEFSARHVNAWGQRTAQDIIEGTRQFCKEHPYVNDKKIGCLGASYGGFMTQYLQTQTDLFAAAVSHAGISNVTSYWGEGYWGVGYNAVAAAQSYPWSNPELFTRQGSLFNADKINTPLLLLHGTSDTNVPIGESIQLYNALKILGKTVEFVQVDGEDHFIADYPKRVLWHNTIMAWFAKWLQDAPQWWNDIYPERRLQ